MTTSVHASRAAVLPTAATAPTPAGGAFEPSGDVTTGGATGIRVDQHRTLRHVGTGLGLTLAVAGAGLLAARGLGGTGISSVLSRLPLAMPAAIGGAVLGGGMVLGSLTGLRAKDRDYTKVVDGSLREASAEADRLGGDVGILPAGDGSWGLMSVDEAKVDEEGAGAVKVSNPPIRFAALTSRDGDTWVRTGDDFVNRGSATAVDARSIDVGDQAAVQSLVGMQVGVSADGTQQVQLGEPLFVGRDRAGVTEQLFEAGVDDAALVDTGAGVVAYRVAGAADQLKARGTGIQPVGAVSLLSDVSGSPRALTPEAIGGGFAASRVPHPVLDVGTIKVDDARSLVGRRVGGTGGSVEHLGKLVSTHKDVNAAVMAAAAQHTRTLVVKLKDGAAVYALPGSADAPLVTALGGGAGALQVVQDRKKYAVSSTGAVKFSGRSIPYDTSEALGAKLDSGSISGKAVKLLGSYPTREAATAAIKGSLDTDTPYVVVEAAGPTGNFHAYAIDTKAGGAAWDQQLGATTMGAWRDDHFRRTVEELERRPSTWGTDVYHYDHTTERTVRFLDTGASRSEVATSPSREVSRTLDHIDRAFDPNEPVGHTVSINGRSYQIQRWIDSTDFESSARSRIDASPNDPSAFVVLERENNRGTYHVYQATPVSYGDDWNDSRADPDLASFSRANSRTYGTTETRAGQYGPDVYHYDVTERWRERIISNDYSSDVTDRTSPSIDRVLVSVDRTPPPPPPSHTSPGDDSGTGGNHTSPGDDNGSSGGTSPGDDNGSTGGTGSHSGGTSSGDDSGSGSTPPPSSGGSTSSGDSSDNGNPGDDDF
jgi:hypothetical protein